MLLMLALRAADGHDAGLEALFFAVDGNRRGG